VSGRAGATPAAPPGAGRGDRPLRRARVVVILGALSAFGPLSIDMYLPGLPSLGATLDAPAWAVQLTLTACLAGLALGQIVAGPLSDRFGRRTPLLVGVSAYAAASLLCALAPTILALVIGGQVLRVTTWRGVFVLLAGVGVVLAVAAATGLRETLAPGDRHPGGIAETVRTFGRLLGDRVFLGHALACGLAFGAMFAYISGSPFVLQDIYGASPQAFSVLFAANALGIVGASQANRALLRRFAPRTILRTALVVQASAGVALLAVVLAGAGVWGIVPLLFLVVASLGLVLPNATALALAGHPRVAGSASGLLGVLQFIVGAAAAPLVGIAGTGTAVPMATVIAVLAVGAVLSATVLVPSEPLRARVVAPWR